MWSFGAQPVARCSLSAASPPSGAGSRAARVKLALAAAALVGALLFLLVPLTRVLALDFTALLRNLTLGHYESYPIKESWFAWGDAALRLGALPWALIMAAAVLLRLQARWIPGSFSLAGASPRLRLALAAAALVPLLAFALPFGLALCTWTMVETHWWIQWYGNREPALWLILYDALPVFVAGLILAGLWTTALALRGAAPRRSGWRRWGQAALVGLAALVSAPVLLATASPLALHGSRLLGSLNSVALFEKKCSGCHDVTRPLYAVNTPDQWEKLVRRIKKHEVLALTAAEDQNLAGFLRGMRSFSES